MVAGMKFLIMLQLQWVTVKMKRKLYCYKKRLIIVPMKRIKQKATLTHIFIEVFISKATITTV